MTTPQRMAAHRRRLRCRVENSICEGLALLYDVRRYLNGSLETVDRIEEELRAANGYSSQLGQFEGQK